jgi:hypothetical protein
VRDSRGTPVELVVRLSGLGGGHPDWAVVWVVSFESVLSEDRVISRSLLRMRVYRARSRSSWWTGRVIQELCDNDKNGVR